MSNKILVQTQNFFVDTAKPAIGECRNATFVLPQGLMDCADHQDMTLVLNSFSMAKNWYRVNQLNNVFYIVGLSDGTKPNRTVDSVRVELIPGDYQFFEPNAFLTPAQFSKSLGNQLEFQIQRSLQIAHNTGVKSFKTTAHFNALTKRYVIEINTSGFHHPYANGMKLVCFTINASVPIDQGSIINSILNTPAVQADEQLYATGESLGLPTATPSAPLQWGLWSEFSPPNPGNPTWTPTTGDVITWNVGGKYYHSTIVSAEGGLSITVALQLSIASFGTGAKPTDLELPIGTKIDFHRLLNDDPVDVHPGSTERAVNFAKDGTAALIINDDYPAFFAGDNNNIFHGYSMRDTTTATGATFTEPLQADKTWFPNTGTGATTPILFAEMSGVDAETIPTGTALTVFQEVGMTFATATTLEVTDTASNIYFFKNASLAEGPTWSGSPGSLPTNLTISSATYATDPKKITLTLSGNHGQTLGTSNNIEFRSTNDIDPTFLQKYGKVFIQPTITNNLVNHTLSWTGMPTDAEHPKVITQADGMPVIGVNKSTILTTNFWDPDNVTDRDRWVQISKGSTVLSRGRNVVGGVNRSLNQFQSTWEVLGGCYEDRGVLPGNDATDEFENLRPMFPMTSDGTADTTKYGFGFTAPFNACLQPEENIYLRTNLNSANFQTPGFDTGLQTNVAQSQILAKIPLMNPTFAGVYEYTFNTADPPVADVSSVYQYERPYEIIYYSDNGNNKYSIMMSQKRTTQIRLFVTDKYGRLIPEMSAEQINCGALSFAASLRIDIHERM